MLLEKDDGHLPQLYLAELALLSEGITVVAILDTIFLANHICWMTEF